MRILLTLTLFLVALQAHGQRFVKTFASIADMVAANPNDVHNQCAVSGYYTPADGGGGNFVWVAADGTTADNGIYFESTNPSAQPGRWKRVFSGPLSVLYYGAKRDGSVDAQPAIQAAIEASRDGPSEVVYLPAGTYKVTSTLEIDWRVVLAGDGRLSIIRFESPTVDDVCIRIEDIDNVTIRDLQIDCARSAQGQTGLKLDGSPGVGPITEFRLEGVRIHDFHRYAVDISYSFYLHFRDCRFQRVDNSVTQGGDGLYQGRAINMTNVVNYVTFDQCTWNLNDIDVDFRYGYTVNFNNCSFEATGISNLADTSALNFVQAFGLTIQACYFEQPRTGTNTAENAVVYLDNCQGVKLDGGIYVGRFNGIVYPYCWVTQTNNTRGVEISGIYFEETNDDYFISDSTSSIMRARSLSIQQSFAYITSFDQLVSRLTVNKVEWEDNLLWAVRRPVTINYVNDNTDPILTLTRGTGGQIWSIHENNNDFVVRDGTANIDRMSMTDGNGFLGINQTAPTTQFHARYVLGANNAMSTVAAVLSEPSGAPATGVGAAMRFEAPRATSDNAQMGRIGFRFDQLGAGLEDSSFVIETVDNSAIGTPLIVGSKLTTIAVPLEWSTTSTNTWGLKVNVLTTTQRDALTSPPDGAVFFNSTTTKLQVRAGGAWVDLH